MVSYLPYTQGIRFDSLRDSYSTKNIDYKISRLAHIGTTFGQWMSTVMLYYVKKISYYAVQKEKLYFLMKYSVQERPFICDYVII